MPEITTRRRLDQPLHVPPPVRASTRTRSRRLSERIARFLGTGRFLAIQTVIVVVWIALNLAGGVAGSGTRTRSSCSTWPSRRRPRTPRR